MIEEPTAASALIKRGNDRKAIVELDPDHPGFRDNAYRERRNMIATIALDHQPGTPVPDAPYTSEEHALWKKITADIQPVHAQYACQTYLEGWKTLDLPKDEIPQLKLVSSRLQKTTGFSFEPVAGMVTARAFLENLAERTMLCTQYIRHYSKPLFTPEPDVVHELIGHAPFFTDPDFAEIGQAFGRAAKAADDEEMERLNRLYWYTIEFGLLKEGDEIKAYGAGLLSSIEEQQRIHETDLRPFDIDAMATTDFDPTQHQQTLFVAESMDQVKSELQKYLGIS